MPLETETLFFLTELIGTVAFSVSGATIAIERGLDLFGVAFLGAATAIGGGVIRDMLLGQVPPRAFQNTIYLTVALGTALAVFCLFWWRQRRSGRPHSIGPAALNLCDAAGLGLFTVVGVQSGLDAGFGARMAYCVFLGLTTGVGGGMLRDILSHATPAVLRKHIYAVASLCGAVCYYLMQRRDRPGAILFSVLLVMVLRVLASHYRWTLPRLEPPPEKNQPPK